MKFFNLPDERVRREDTPIFKPSVPVLLFIFLLLTWCFLPQWLHRIDETAGNIDQSIWLLILLSLITFLLICGLCWWLMQQFWLVLQLPPIEMMVSQFKVLPIWQQLSFYYASFALFLAAALGCLIAIC
ncbi:hypothetical protein ACSBL2_11870 [Pedobacter sp. AW31-3R]|uniref:hypothetical protein n=1 Tax=Pedobacter sp. AW31-3R TaxID=3445781 RepID=UPI003F9FFEC9